MMTDEHIQLLNQLRANIEKLKVAYQAEKEKNLQLTIQLEQERKSVRIAHKEQLELQSKYDNLIMSAMLSATENDRQRNRQKLSKMVREIDKCLALLNQ